MQEGDLDFAFVVRSVGSNDNYGSGFYTYAYDPSITRILVHGGKWNDEYEAGIFYASINSNPSDSGWGIGTRLELR